MPKGTPADDGKPNLAAADSQKVIAQAKNGVPQRPSPSNGPSVSMPPPSPSAKPKYSSPKVSQGAASRIGRAPPLTARPHRISTNCSTMPLSARGSGEVGGSAIRCSSAGALLAVGSLSQLSRSSSVAEPLSPRDLIRNLSSYRLPSSVPDKENVASEESHRLISAEDEMRLRLQGEKEKRLKDQRDARERARLASLREDAARHAERRKLEAMAKEEKEQKIEAEKLKRALDIEERKRQAELRAWEREQTAENDASIQISPRLALRSLSNDLSRDEEWQLEENKLKQKSEKELQHLQVREANRRAIEARNKRRQEIHADWVQRQRRLEASRAEKRREEEAKRQKAREQRNAKAESKASRRSIISLEQNQKIIIDHQTREQEAQRKEQEMNEGRLRELKIRGERERLHQEAKDLKTREKILKEKQQDLTRVAQEERSKQIQEFKDKRLQEAKLRRFLDIEKRQEKAESQRRDRENKKHAEDDRNVVYFVQPQGKAKVQGRAACRSLSPSWCGG